MSNKFSVSRFYIELHEYRTSSCTKATTLLDLKSCYVKMIIYRPASFLAMQISWKYKLIIKYGRHLSIDWFIDKKYIFGSNFITKLTKITRILFLEKSGLERNKWSLKFMYRSAFFWRVIALWTVSVFWAKQYRKRLGWGQILQSRYLLRFLFQQNFWF